jgi:beta-lactamase superfamily II metal-dependent hydrolase
VLTRFSHPRGWQLEHRLHWFDDEDAVHLASSFINASADVLKLGHHGSRTSSTSPLVEAVRPRLGLVSSGAGNRYGHPSPEILDRFAQQQIPLLRTDHDGNIEVRTDGERLEVRAGGARWVLP